MDYFNNYGYGQNFGQYQQYQPQYKPNQGFVWVSGETGAKSYIVPAGQTALLMDSEQNRFYLKTADQSGMPTIRVFDYKENKQEIPQPQAHVDTDIYVTRKEFDEIKAALEELKTTRKKEAENE